ncbi:hypothetical protein ANCDUO_25246, partial [Ancylostoma duodenale]
LPFRFVVKSLPSGLSTLRIDPVLATDNQTTVSCSADNGVANPVVADAVITVLDEAQLPAGFPVVDAHPTLKSVEQGRTAHVTCRVSVTALLSQYASVSYYFVQMT